MRLLLPSLEPYTGCMSCCAMLRPVRPSGAGGGVAMLTHLVADARDGGLRGARRQSGEWRGVVGAVRWRSGAGRMLAIR